MNSHEELVSHTLFYLDQSGDHSRHRDFLSMVAEVLEEDSKFLLGRWLLTTPKPHLEELQKFDQKEVKDFYVKNYMLPSLILLGNAYLSLPQSTLDLLSLDWLDGKLLFNQTEDCYQMCVNHKLVTLSQV